MKITPVFNDLINTDTFLNHVEIKDNQEKLRLYYEINIGLSAIEELRKKFIQSQKYDTVIIKRKDLEIFLQNILLSLDHANNLIDGYCGIKERSGLLQDVYLKASERELYFMEKLKERM